jgi:hypothetical protein
MATISVDLLAHHNGPEGHHHDRCEGRMKSTTKESSSIGNTRESFEGPLGSRLRKFDCFMIRLDRSGKDLGLL